MKRIVIVLFLIICILGLSLELRFFSNTSDRRTNQRIINPYIEAVEAEYNESVTAFQLYEDTIIFKITNSCQIEDLEQVVIRFEEYKLSDSDSGFVKRIKFVDESVVDTLIPRTGDCVIEYCFDKNNEIYSIINIYSVNADTYGQFADFSSYQSLLRQYEFNVFTEMIIEENDDFSVISTWYCRPDIICQGSEYLSQQHVNIISERCDADD